MRRPWPSAAIRASPQRGRGRPTDASTATTIRWPRPASATRSPCCRRSTPTPVQRDPRVAQVMASLAGERRVVEILRADGRLIRDVRPLGATQRPGHRRAGRSPRERHVGRRRPGRFRGLDHPGQVARAGRGGPAPGPGEPRSRRLSGRRDGRGAWARLERRAAPRGRRPRPRGRFQPQGNLGLLRPDRRARRRPGRDGVRRRLDRRSARLAERRRRGHAHLAHHPHRGRHPARATCTTARAPG